MFDKDFLTSPLERLSRKYDSRILLPITQLLSKLGISPIALTVAGLIVQLVVAFLLAKGYMLAGGLMYSFGGIIDMLDGELARLKKQETALGSFLDSMFDQYGDFLIFLGLLWFYLNIESKGEIILIFLALFGAMLNSHARSRGGMLGVEGKSGLMTRAERFPIMVICLVLNQIHLMLWILVLLNHFSAIQRIAFVVRNLSKRG